MRRTMLALTVMTILAALGTMACGGDEENAANQLTANLSEWKIELDKTTLPAGKTKIAAKNNGTMEHELVIIKTGTPPDQLPKTATQVDESKAGQTIDEIKEFKAGRTESKTVDLAAGNYVLICNIAGHYLSGMYIKLTVQ